MEINTSRYIGIPWKFNGSDVSGADCIGLVRLFYKDHSWKEDFQDGKTVEKDWYTKDPSRMMRYLAKNFNKTENINELEYGDLIILRIREESHIGIYLGYGKILHTFPPPNELVTTASYIERMKHLQQYFRAGFKRRK